MKTILSRSKTILSGDDGDVVTPREGGEPFWLELVRLPTGTYLECQNQNIKAWHHALAPHMNPPMWRVGKPSRELRGS